MMKKLLQTVAVSALLLAPAAAQAQVSFGIRLGEPPPPRAYRVPDRPGPDYVWVEGYQYPIGNRYAWHDGYWTRPPYEGAYWVAPYYWNGRYYGGHWEGGHRNFDHNHRWDYDRQRDEGRWRGDNDRDDRDRGRYGRDRDDRDRR